MSSVRNFAHTLFRSTGKWTLAGWEGEGVQRAGMCVGAMKEVHEENNIKYLTIPVKRLKV